MLHPDSAFGTAGAPGAGSPFFGAKLLIADRGNNRLLLMNSAMRVVWKYPAMGLSRDPLRFQFPDDAFFTDHGTVAHPRRLTPTRGSTRASASWSPQP